MISDTLNLRKQRGFTLIELVIVIVIIGILAAIALPKFASLSSDARAGVIKGVAGSAASANIAIYSQAAAQGKLTGTTTITSTACGGSVINTKNGYALAMSDLYLCLTLTPPGDFLQVGATIQHAKANLVTGCVVTYGGNTAATDPPTYTTTITDC